MKKLISIFAILACITSFAIADAAFTEENYQDLRLELGITGFANSNFLCSGVGLDEQVTLSTYHNRVGLILGVREDLDFLNGNQMYLIPNWTPYVGIDLWNFDLICGLDPTVIGKDNGSLVSMAQLAYNIHFIKPNSNPVSNSLSMKIGLNWYLNHFNHFQFAQDSSKTSEEQLGDAIGSTFLVIFGVIIPRVEIGVTYRLGHEFILR